MNRNTPICRHLCRPGLTFAALSFGIAALTEDAPTVTPYRPSVSTPAALSAPGWLEIEAGVQRSRADDPVRRESLPYTVKLAFSPDWGVRIGGDALVHQTGADGTAQRGGGDTAIVLKRRFALSEASAFGLEMGAKLPTAASGLGSGHTDVGLNGVFSSDLADNWHTDINLVATHLGGMEAGTSPWQYSCAVALSRNLSERLGAVGELSGTRQTANPRTAQALLATSYALTRSVTLDIGVSKGLNAASGGWSVFSGLTFLAARLF